MDTHKFFSDKQNQKSFKLIAIGGIILATLLVLTGIWISRTTQLSTNEAVHSVSKFYLQELSARCKQVVESKMDNATLDLKNALSTIEDSDLQSQATLQNWLRKMEIICDTKEIGLIAKNGTAYTARNTQHVVERHYAPKIDDATGEITLSVPVNDLPFLGTTIFEAFTVIDINEALDKHAMPMCAEDDTICNLYENDGKPLTHFMDEVFPHNQNLFDAIKDLKFADGYTYENLKSDFADDKAGMTSFFMNGNEVLLFYSPIKNSNFILTCFIRENKIGDQVASISEEMLHRNSIQIGLTIAVMAIICGFIL